jgi:Ca-activated chloride channel family protein
MEALRFENIEYLYALFAVPFFILLFLIYRAKTKKAISKFATSEIFQKLSPDKSAFKPVFKLILFILAFSSVVIAIANPQIGSKMEEVKREGAEIFVAIDLSNSMSSEDIKPNRLEKAKRAVINLIDKLYNDRIGIIVFAGNAYLHLPLTTDYSAAKLIVSTLDNNIIETQGTAIGSAIELAQESFSEDDARNKALIIITDGENHEDDALGAAKEANENGITIHTIGMGSINGGPIPVYRNNQRVGFLKDSEGNTVVSKLDAAALEQIASAGDGKFIRSGNTEPDLKKLIDELENLDREEFEAKVFTDYEDQFQYFLGFAILLLLFDILVSSRKNKYLSSLNAFAGGKKKQEN